MTCWVALISWATLANGFTEVLAAFIPIIKEGWIQKLAAITVVSVLTAINLFGVQWGAPLYTEQINSRKYTYHGDCSKLLYPSFLNDRNKGCEYFGKSIRQCSP